MLDIELECPSQRPLPATGGVDSNLGLFRLTPHQEIEFPVHGDLIP